MPKIPNEEKKIIQDELLEWVELDLTPNQKEEFINSDDCTYNDLDISLDETLDNSIWS